MTFGSHFLDYIWCLTRTRKIWLMKNVFQVKEKWSGFEGNWLPLQKKKGKSFSILNTNPPTLLHLLHSSTSLHCCHRRPPPPWSSASFFLTSRIFFGSGVKTHCRRRKLVLCFLPLSWKPEAKMRIRVWENKNLREKL